jgi:hypothetical protein
VIVENDQEWRSSSGPRGQAKKARKALVEALEDQHGKEAKTAGRNLADVVAEVLRLGLYPVEDYQDVDSSFDAEGV